MGEDLCRAGTTKKLDRFSCASLYLRSIGKEGRGGEKKRDYRVHNGEGPSSLKLFWRRYACVHAILSFFPSFLRPPFPLSPPSHALVRAQRLMHAKLHARIA